MSGRLKRPIEGIEPYSGCGRCGHDHSAQETGSPCVQCLSQHRFEDRCCRTFVPCADPSGRAV